MKNKVSLVIPAVLVMSSFAFSALALDASAGASVTAGASATPVVMTANATTPAVAPAPGAAPAAMMKSKSMMKMEVMHMGSHSENVGWLQDFLSDHGFMKKPSASARTHFGAGTRAGVMKFQKSVGLKATGVYDAKANAKVMSMMAAQ